MVDNLPNQILTCPGQVGKGEHQTQSEHFESTTNLTVHVVVKEELELSLLNYKCIMFSK